MSEQIQRTISILKDFLYEVDDLSYEVERSKEYHGMTRDPNFGVLFFHSYLKCRRSFIAVDELLKSEVTSKFKHAYIEAFPYLRIMTECYIHFCYITDEPKNKQIMIKQYKAIKDFQLQKILKISRVKYQNIKDREQGTEFISKFKRKKINPPFFYNNMYKLAKKTDNLGLYKRVFTNYNPYIHFNPINYTVYGSFKGNQFTFNDLDDSSRRLEGELLFYCIEVMIRLIRRTFDFLKIPEFEKLRLTLGKWNKMKDEIQITLLQ